MKIHTFTPFGGSQPVCFGLLLLCLPLELFGKRACAAGGRLAVVVDERLSALRATPELNGVLLRRVGRGVCCRQGREKKSRGSGFLPRQRHQPDEWLDTT